MYTLINNSTVHNIVIVAAKRLPEGVTLNVSPEPDELGNPTRIVVIGIQ